MSNKNTDYRAARQAKERQRNSIGNAQEYVEGPESKEFTYLGYDDNPTSGNLTMRGAGAAQRGKKYRLS